VIDPSALRAAKAPPSGSGYTKIYSTGSAFAALKADGSITVWGDSGGTGAPSGDGYTKIYSTKIITGTKEIHLRKTPLFYCFFPIIFQ
jgi:hypothetical protein